MIDRHNYGFVLTKRGEVQVATAMARLIFTYKLPEMLNPIPRNLDADCRWTRNYQSLNFSACRNVRRLVQEYHQMYLRMQTHLRTQLRKIYAVMIDIPPRLQSISKRSGWSNFLSKITGLAEEERLDEVIGMLVHLERSILEANKIWKAGDQHFLASFKVERTRIDNILHLMQIQRQSIIQIQSELVQGFTKSQSRIHVWTHISQTVFNFSLQISEIDQLYEATELLTMGKLPHFFVEHRTLAKALVKLDSFLKTNNPELRLLQTDLKYYYKQACFHSYRYTNFIVIVIQAPLTIAPLNRLMNVYHLYRIPLAAPNSKDHYTMLATNIKALYLSPRPGLLPKYFRRSLFADKRHFRLKKFAVIVTDPIENELWLGIDRGGFERVENILSLSHCKREHPCGNCQNNK